MTNDELTDLRVAKVITANEFDVLLLQLRGLSQWQIALTLDLSRWAVRDRLKNGHRKIELHHRLPRKDHAA